MNEYIDPNRKPVKISEEASKRIIHKAKKVLVLQRSGVDLLYGDVLDTEKKLSCLV